MDDEHLRGRDGELRLSAYYYGFAPTGVVEIDRILAAVAIAGKGYHSTECWCDELSGRTDGKSYVDFIQDAANEAAKALVSREDGAER